MILMLGHLAHLTWPAAAKKVFALPSRDPLEGTFGQPPAKGSGPAANKQHTPHSLAATLPKQQLQQQQPQRQQQQQPQTVAKSVALEGAGDKLTAGSGASDSTTTTAAPAAAEPVGPGPRPTSLAGSVASVQGVAEYAAKRLGVDVEKGNLQPEDATKSTRGIRLRSNSTSNLGRAQPLNPEDAGFGRYAECQKNTPHVTDSLRFTVRDLTASRVLEQLGYSAEKDEADSFEESAGKLLRNVGRQLQRLPAGVRAQMKSVRLFVQSPNKDPSSMVAPAQETYLLGQFDCLCVPARADFGSAFMPMGSNPGGELTPRKRFEDCDGADAFHGWFWVLHQAAPNIGETVRHQTFLPMLRMWLP